MLTDFDVGAGVKQMLHGASKFGAGEILATGRAEWNDRGEDGVVDEGRGGGGGGRRARLSVAAIVGRCARDGRGKGYQRSKA